MDSYKLPLEEQRELFLEIVLKNPVVQAVLDGGFVGEINNWYLVAGCLNQTLWNYFTQKEIQHGINDYDIIYFDKDISKNKETKIGELVKAKYKSTNADFDVVNQARVHIWIEKEWGLRMRPLISAEDAIASWPITASCVGVRKEKGESVVMAPYGLTDSLEMVLRPNKTTVMRESDFYSKVTKWKEKWPELTVLPW